MKILVRLASDMTIKSDRIRAKFVGRLIRNMTQAFQAHGLTAEVERHWSRLYVRCDDPRVVDVLARIFGILSLSIVEHECDAELDEIVAVGTAAYRELVRGKTFAVRARRVGSHGFTSMDVAKALGAQLRPEALRVELKDPQVEVHVEIRERAVFMFSGKVEGAGGLPLGVSGKALCLLSGGFDSAVAAWRMQKRGVETDYLFCNLAGPAYERSVLGLAKRLWDLWGYGSRARLHVVDFGQIAAAIRADVKPSHVQVVLKRMFYRVAERVAAALEVPALVTGECIGQVSSQTLRNLTTIEAAIRLPILRPVIGMDKDEIIGQARRIGTFALSAAVEEYCQLVPDKPATSCRPEAADRHEERLDIQGLVNACLTSRRSFLLSAVTSADLVGPYIFTDSVMEGALVIDCRSAEDFAAWHHPAACHRELHDLLRDFRELDKAKTYVVYCLHGLQSAVAAEAMQRAGYQAYSLRGGMRTLTVTGVAPG